MKLVYYSLNLSFEIEKGKMTSIVLENPVVFERFLIDFHKHLEKEGEFFSVFTDTASSDLTKIGDLVSSPFDLHFEKREVQKRLYMELQKSAEENDTGHILAEYHGKMVQAMETLTFASDYEIEINEEFSIQEILKNFSVHIKDPEGSFVEKLTEYMMTANRLLGKKLFLLSNCDAYVADMEYAYIEECAAYYDICIIFLRNQQIQLPFAISEYIIDMDLCEIH